MLELDGTIIIAMISFIVFGFIMNAVLYEPVLKIIEERKAYLASNSDAEKRAIKETQEFTEKRESELEKSKKDARLIVSEGTQKFKTKHAEVIKEFVEQQRNRADVEKQQLNVEAEQAKYVIDDSANELAGIIEGKVLGKDRANV